MLKRIGIPDSSTLYENTRIEKELPVILRYLIQWEHMALYLRLIHISLGVSATFFSILAAAQIGSIHNELVRIFAFIAAVSIALMTGFNLGEKSNNVRNSWRELNSAIMKFNSDEKFQRRKQFNPMTMEKNELEMLRFPVVDLIKP
jgi:hypothetical protein